MNSPAPQVLITGANRGIGLEFARQYAGAGYRVIACCRAPQRATQLDALAVSCAGQVAVHALDVADFGQVGRLASELKGQAVDVLINNAGFYPPGGSIDYDQWHQAFLINAMAPMRMVECFVEHVAASRQRKIVTLSSRMGSVADNDGGGSLLYRSSKAAVNMVMKNLAVELKPRGIAVGTLHPGWVMTDMGGANAPITPEQSVAGMRRVIEQLSIDNTGRFLAYDGQQIPW